MDSYLSLAETVLRAIRRPLNSREIIQCAYSQGLVPPQLFGKTQHKTLGARLSEDILDRRDRSAFYRAEPGRFFLRAFLEDPETPEKYRTPIIARRRKRELLQGKALSLLYADIESRVNSRCASLDLVEMLKENKFYYIADLNGRSINEVLVWSFVIVTRGEFVLTYRHGRYREDRDHFLQRRSVGFFTPVIDRDYDLFDDGDKGIIASGLKAVIMDLDLPSTGNEEYYAKSSLECGLYPRDGDSKFRDLLAVVRFECPTWFEPLSRRLAINDLSWMEIRAPINHMEDFDPWSQQVLNLVRKTS